MLSLAKPENYYQVFLSQGVGMGIGTGMLYMPLSGVVANHFTQRRGLALVGFNPHFLYALNFEHGSTRESLPLDPRLEVLPSLPCSHMSWWER